MPPDEKSKIEQMRLLKSGDENPLVHRHNLEIILISSYRVKLLIRQNSISYLEE